MRNLRTSCQTRSRPGGIFYSCLKGCFVGIILGFSLALLSASWVWLEMRINTGLMIPITMVVFLAVAVWKDNILRYRLFIFIQILLTATFIALYGLDPVALRVVPASLFREGFHMAVMSIDAANILLIVILIGGNVFMRWITRFSLPVDMKSETP